MMCSQVVAKENLVSQINLEKDKKESLIFTDFAHVTLKSSKQYHSYSQLPSATYTR
jgi:hypothetical protein